MKVIELFKIKIILKEKIEILYILKFKYFFFVFSILI